MPAEPFKRAGKPAVLVLLVFLFFAARLGYCGYTADCDQAPFWITGSWTVEDCLRFEASLDETAKTSTPEKVSNTLLAIVPPRRYPGPPEMPPWPEDSINRQRLRGGEISWEGEPGKSRIRVAAFMDKQSYLEWYYPCMFGGPDGSGTVHPAGGEALSVLKKSLWVTVVPELRNYFWSRQQASCPPGKERVMELLGLNPRKAYDVVLEMWVYPEDLYRPAPDPEITDHRAEVAVPLEETLRVRDTDCRTWALPDPFLFFSTDQSYQSWFAYNAATTYYNPSAPQNTAPWTRLGYTYDWGSRRDHIGASEFMIRLRPDLDGYGARGVYATYIRAIKVYDRSWNEYFRCRWRHDRINADNVPDADINPAVR